MLTPVGRFAHLLLASIGAAAANIYSFDETVIKNNQVHVLGSTFMSQEIFRALQMDIYFDTAYAIVDYMQTEIQNLDAIPSPYLAVFNAEKKPN